MRIFIQNIKEGVQTIKETLQPSETALPEIASYTAPLQVVVDVNRFEDALRLKIDVKTEVLWQCDRCLEEFKTNFSANSEHIFQFGAGNLKDDDEVEIIKPDTKELDISKTIHDIFIENRPIRLLCNPECKGLCPSCGKNLNISMCKCNNKSIDPRLEKLKELLKQE